MQKPRKSIEWAGIGDFLASKCYGWDDGCGQNFFSKKIKKSAFGALLLKVLDSFYKDLDLIWANIRINSMS